MKMIAKSKNGKAVYINERTEEHMQAHDDVKMSDIQEAISRIDLVDQFTIGPVDLGRVIGKSHCVVRKDGDDVKMLYRKGRDGKTPMVFNRESEDTTSIVIGICIDKMTGEYRLFTSWYGVLAKKEPWDPSIKDEKELAECQEFWNTHALTNIECIDWEREV